MSEWNDCEDRLPQMYYCESMDYWYSERVEVQNALGKTWRQCLKGHEEDSGGWGSCTGGQPVKWRHIE